MHCLKCDYPLWNLAPGSCPECGTPFKPTDREFPVGRARFCCPDCDQAYYGDGPEGHLQPSEFECVSCNRHLTEDDCIIRPLEGNDEIVSSVAPWFQPSVGLFSRFFRTCGWSMVRPIELGKGTPLTGSTAAAVGFMSLIQLLGVVVGGFPLMALVMVAPMFAGARGGGGMTTAFPLLIVASAGVFGAVAFILLNACVVHLVLVWTGRLEHGLGRTVTLCCLGTGPAILVAIPCFGPYCGSYVSGIWMIVSTILVLIHGQRVSGWRASVAVLAFPTFLVALGVAALLFVRFWSAVPAGGGVVMPRPGSAMTAMTAEPTALISDHTQEIAEALRIVVRDSDSESPEVFLTAVDRLVPGLLQVDATDMIQIDGNGFRGWQNADMFLLVAPGAGAILVIPTAEDAASHRFQIVEVSGMIESSSKIEEGELRRDLVRRLDGLGARGRDLTSLQVRNWVESVGGDPVSSP